MRNFRYDENEVQVNSCYAVTAVHDACATKNVEFDGPAAPAAQVHSTSMAPLAFRYASIATTDMWLAEFFVLLFACRPSPGFFAAIWSSRLDDFTSGSLRNLSAFVPHS